MAGRRASGGATGWRHELWHPFVGSGRARRAAPQNRPRNQANGLVRRLAVHGPYNRGDPSSEQTRHPCRLAKRGAFQCQTVVGPVGPLSTPTKAGVLHRAKIDGFSVILGRCTRQLEPGGAQVGREHLLPDCSSRQLPSIDHAVTQPDSGCAMGGTEQADCGRPRLDRGSGRRSLTLSVPAPRRALSLLRAFFAHPHMQRHRF